MTGARWRAAVAVSVASAGLASAPGRGLRASDVETLQGTWRVIDARARMLNEPAMIIDGMVGRGTIIFTGHQVTMRELGDSDRATYEFTLDTMAVPRRIRLVDPTVADSGRWTGIYRIRGDTLRLSLPVEHYSARPIPPASFNGTNTVAYIFLRDSSSRTERQLKPGIDSRR
jgi:uncharacterized protein (TIGR03067 family)